MQITDNATTPVVTPATPAAPSPAAVAESGLPSAREPTTSAPPRHHRPSPRRLLLVGALLVGLALLIVLRWLPAPTDGQVSAVGTLEATEVNVAAEVTARIRDITVVEGQPVRVGEVLVQLDDTLPRLQFRQAGAAEQQVVAVQLARYTLSAPLDGVVLRRMAEPGEVAVAGAPLLALSDRSHLDLTVYLLQRELARVYVGQQVVVAAEALPALQARGQVRSIGERAEFTPRNAQTPRDRLNLVYAVKVRVEAPDPRLKPGMSALARFED